MAEVRNLPEGSLRWVQASGTGRTWATASAPASGLIGFVQEGMTFTSGQTITQIMERGIPDHHKLVSKNAIQVSFTFMWTGSAQFPVSGSGASVPMYHLEYRASAVEYAGAPSGFFYQFHGVALSQQSFTENGNGDQIQFQGIALGMVGPTASGYLS